MATLAHCFPLLSTWRGMEAGSGRMTSAGPEVSDAGSAPAQRSDSQSVKTEKGGLRCGQEGEGPQTALGLLLAGDPANIDWDGAKLVLEGMVGQYLKVIWADGAYGGKLVQSMGGWSTALGATDFPGTAPALGSRANLPG